MIKALTRITGLLFCLYFWLPEASAQPTLSFDLKKPAKYENRKLGSEKTEEKKFTVVRRFTQNGVTKFNWHFNAQNKLNEIIARAKARHQDDYTQLLSFYNYSLENTAQDKNELDSVIYKANAGILIHDLRNSWIDNLYMLMGEAYYFKNELDSAYLTFQYINYVFAPKEKDGYDKPIGSNADEGNAFSISTKENGNVFNRIWTTPPSRNESLIWQIRTYLARNEYPEAAGLMETLKADPQFPARLEPDLREMQALWFYKQEIYDSAAIYLDKALENATNKQEQARWEYLIAQLYEQVKKPDLAADFYQRAIRHTLNPVLEVYARLNAIRQHKNDDKAIQETINNLVKMARKDRYTTYRDIIYYAAAQVELERNNITGAKKLLLKSTQASAEVASADNNQRTRSFLLLGDLSFREKNFAESKRFYDSVNTVDPKIIDPQVLDKRKQLLAEIVTQQEVITRQDSLQRIAQLPEAEREALVRKMLKQLRKQQGLKEEELTGGSTNNNNLLPDPKTPPPDLFGTSDTKGEWYFYNANLKAKGYTEFRTRWGNRPNVDNWRRMADVNKNMNQQQATAPADPGNVLTGNAAATSELSYEGLLKNIPLTTQQLAASNDSIDNAQYRLGKLQVDGLEDYEQAIALLEAHLTRFPYSSNRPEVLFLLHYCYMKTGNPARAKELANELKQNYGGTAFERKLSDAAGSKGATGAADMTNRYEKIYNLFIEGSFTEALEQKKIADSLYGNHYWTPQLLYIQSIYHIRQRQDDSANKVLQQIIALYPASPLAARARTMVDVLSRRKEIEDYLTKLQIERPETDSASITVQPPVVTTVIRQPGQQPVAPKDQPPVVPPTGTTQPPVNQPPTATPPTAVTQVPAAQPPVVDNKIGPPVVPPAVARDSATNRTTLPKPTNRPANGSLYTYDPNVAHYVALVLDKVDPVYVTEARNAFNRYNKEKYYNKPINIDNLALTDDVKLVLMDNFADATTALEYVDKTRAVAGSSIIPWMPAGKYSFIIITEQNLEVLKGSKDMNLYRQFLSQSFPGKF